MRAAKISNPTLKAIWQIIARDSGVNPTARTRMQKALEQADATSAVASERDKATTALTTLTSQLAGIRAAVLEVMPTLDPATTDEALLALAAQILAEAKRAREAERTKLVEIGRHEDGHTTHTLVMRALEALHDRSDEKGPGTTVDDPGGEPAQTDGRAGAADSSPGTARRASRKS
jgi:hypothetical protein